jgi:hypothetical protein
MSQILLFSHWQMPESVYHYTFELLKRKDFFEKTKKSYNWLLELTSFDFLKKETIKIYPKGKSFIIEFPYRIHFLCNFRNRIAVVMASVRAWCREKEGISYFFARESN